jgi:hypothetical protein
VVQVALEVVVQVLEAEQVLLEHQTLAEAEVEPMVLGHQLQVVLVALVV